MLSDERIDEIFCEYSSHESPSAGPLATDTDFIKMAEILISEAVAPLKEQIEALKKSLEGKDQERRDLHEHYWKMESATIERCAQICKDTEQDFTVLANKAGPDTRLDYVWAATAAKKCAEAILKLTKQNKESE